ncbi:hypothetical protein K2173_022553 [Erythroxylum novogranatense]|uniref:Uncharacterized protein n=1 Tax=Erythroxylum novogranatense TaxID=1862640 RepID=A0AAV8TK10_9ROSI|nr:hypothetical protein K2173_022553 [Erythroxylum novogranatense]
MAGSSPEVGFSITTIAAENTQTKTTHETASLSAYELDQSRWFGFAERRRERKKEKAASVCVTVLFVYIEKISNCLFDYLFLFRVLFLHFTSVSV